MKKSILICIALSMSFQVYAANNSISKGQALTERGYCYTCHGDKGIALSRNSPSLAGQSPLYLTKVMNDYRNKHIKIDHKSVGMQAMMQPLSNTDIKNIAAYYSSQAPAVSAANNKNPNDAGACLGCHSLSGRPGLKGAAPGLAGMSALYIKRQLQAYKTGLRSNTMMNRFTKKLSAAQIEKLSQFYGF